MSATARNVAIILVLALALVALPGGGPVADTLLALLNFAFLGALAWFGSRLYREHRAAIHSLGERRRALLYGALAVAFVTVTATSRLWETGGGTLLWFALVGGASYALFWLYASWRRYE